MRGKHTGGNNPNYHGRAYNYQTPPENVRQYPRAEPQYHLSGGPGAAPAGMRIHHQQPPPQPSTPPTQHELAAMHQQPPQQGQGQVVFHMNRPVQPPPQPGYRQQPVQAARPPVRTNGSYPQGHQFIPGQQQVGMAFHNLSGIPQQASNLMVVPPGSFIPQGQGARGPFPLFGHGQYTMPHPGYLPYPYYRGNPVGSMPGIIQQPAAAAIPPVSAPSSQPKMRPNRLIITDPVDGHDVVETMFKEEITPSQSGESSARETPQLQNAVSQQQSQAVQQELAIKISNALASEGSSFGDDEQPQQPAVQVAAVPPPHPPNQEIPVETEDVIRPAMDPSGRIVMEHDLQFTGEPVQRWIQPMPMEHMQVPLGMVYGGQGMHHQPPVQQWPAEPIPNMAAQMAPPPPVHAPLPAKKPERATPVVSALAMGPHVDINHDYPALGGQRNTHQSPARSKRRPAPARIEPEPAEISVPAQLPPPVVQLPQQPPVVAAVVAPPPEEVKPPSPVPIAAAPQGPELVAPQEPPVVINDSSNSSSAVDAKVNHHKSKGNKRQHQQQHQQQVRQATPPPPRSATPVQTTLPEPAAAPAPAPAPVPAPVEIVKPEPPAPSIPPLPTPPVPVAPAVAEPPTPAVTPAVDEPVPKPAEIEKKMPESQSTEAIKVAAMNEENDKLTASTKVIEQKLNSTPAEPIKLENKLPLPMPVPNNNNNNNNISNVAPVVKVVVEDLTPTPTQTPPPSLDPAAVIENSKPVIRRIYRDDQWSPENRDGKRIYSREFLMGLQNDPQSQKKPELPFLDVIKAPGNNSNAFTFHSVKKSSSMRGSSGGGGGGGGRGNDHNKRSSLSSKNKINKPPPIQVSLSLNEDVKLRECETPWKPARFQEQTESSEDIKKTETLIKKFRGILNRLTPQKFETLLNQIRALQIDSYERLKHIIDLVFSKAIDEPGYSVMYAELCAELSKLNVARERKNENDKKTEEANFRVLLLHQCQREFEKNPHDQLKREDRLKEIEQETDPEKKKELQMTLEEDERKIRVKAVGNMRFIGELYKKQMITSNIMFTCIDTLINWNTEESLECLCKLLTTIGRPLEKDVNDSISRSKDKGPGDKSKVGIDKYMPKFKMYAENKDNKLSSRVKFMFQDLLDLKKNHWIPRRDDSAPKTMDQIVQEAEREQLETISNNLDSKRMIGGGGGGGNRQDPRSSMDNRNRGRNHDGWTQVPSHPRKQYIDKFELERFKSNQEQTDLDKELVLGGVDQFRWNTGSGAKSDGRKPVSGFSISHNNKYAALEEKSTSRSSSLRGSLANDRLPPPRHSMQEERNSRSSQSSMENSRDSVRGDVGRGSTASMELPTPGATPAAPRTPVVTPSPSPPPLDGEANERATRSLIEEFVSLKDFENASKTLEERFADSVKSEMVLNVFLISVEKNSAFQRAAGRLLSHFLQTAGGITLPQFFNGLKDFVEQADDLLVDIPRLWSYLSEILVDVVAGGVPFADILRVLGPVKSSGSLTTVAEVLRLIHSERPDSRALAASVPALQDYFGSPAPYQAFLRENKLEFLENASAASAAPERAAAAATFDEVRFKEELMRMFRSNLSFDQITQWINANIDPQTSEPAFIRTLTTALIESSLVRKSESCKLNMEVLTRHAHLLSRYVDNKDNRELQLLFAVQAIMNKLEHPKGMLCDLCQFLLDIGVVSTDSFKNWRSSTDNQNAEGRGVCMKSLTSFFTMIDEDEDDTS